MARATTEITVTIKDDNRTLDLIGETMALQNELLDLVPEWMSIEAEQVTEKLSDNWTELINRATGRD